MSAPEHGGWQRESCRATNAADANYCANCGESKAIGHPAVGRRIIHEFVVPFQGNPADVCEDMIDSAIRRSLLNSLSSIHEDIRHRKTVEHFRDPARR